MLQRFFNRTCHLILRKKSIASLILVWVLLFAGGGSAMLTLLHNEARGVMQSRLAHQKPSSMQPADPTDGLKENSAAPVATGPGGARIIGLLAAASLAALLILVWFVASLAKPLQVLKGALASAARGDLTVRMTGSNQDDMGQLAGCFNELMDKLESCSQELETDRIRAEDERTRLQAQLIQAQKMEAIGTLAGGIAHDFNNILSAVMGHVEIAQLDLDSQHPVHQHLDQVLKATHRAKDLVRQILTFSRKSEVNKKPLRLKGVIQEALKLLRASLPATIDIRTQLNTDQDIILADQTQIHQVIMNLCANSAYAMSENGGILEISLVPRDLDAKPARQHFGLEAGRYVALRVSDTGLGMTGSVRERIFDPFFTTKDLGQGTGMGLAVVHGIVKSHGGAIAVNSEPGKGTMFEILFPRINGGALTEPCALLSPLRGSERILFVDDEVLLADLGQQMLERLGYRVETTSNPLDALEAFRSQPDLFDLVVTDMTMPKLAGDVLTRRLRSIRPDIPIILCTGYSERINEEKAAALGINALMLKPLSIDELTRTIRRILDTPAQLMARAC
jgi:signal transduction histidine kinase/ActR/RegA family two-component response regulator